MISYRIYLHILEASWKIVKHSSLFKPHIGDTTVIGVQRPRFMISSYLTPWGYEQPLTCETSLEIKFPSHHLVLPFSHSKTLFRKHCVPKDSKMSVISTAGWRENKGGTHGRMKRLGELSRQTASIFKLVCTYVNDPRSSWYYTSLQTVSCGVATKDVAAEGTWWLMDKVVHLESRF